MRPRPQTGQRPSSWLSKRLFISERGQTPHFPDADAEKIQPPNAGGCDPPDSAKASVSYLSFFFFLPNENPSKTAQSPFSPKLRCCSCLFLLPDLTASPSHCCSSREGKTGKGFPLMFPLPPVHRNQHHHGPSFSAADTQSRPASR